MKSGFFAGSGTLEVWTGLFQPCCIAGVVARDQRVMVRFVKESRGNRPAQCDMMCLSTNKDTWARQQAGTGPSSCIGV